jgi:DNA helicase TIP49 (TBP-interacting protein)
MPFTMGRHQPLSAGTSALRCFPNTAVRALVAERAAGTVVISAIAGAAGVGKTALAVHLAHELAPDFPDVQLYVNLHGYEPAQRLAPTQVLDRFLRALGESRQHIVPR